MFKVETIQESRPYVLWRRVSTKEQGQSALGLDAQRIDWLLSGDDGEESFHERLKEDLSESLK